MPSITNVWTVFTSAAATSLSLVPTPDPTPSRSPAPTPNATPNPSLVAVTPAPISPVPAAQWVQVGNDIDGENPGDQSGRSVALSSNGTVVAIGASDRTRPRAHQR